MKLSKSEKQVVILTMLGEAAGEGQKGMEAVAHVIVNRAASSRWPNTLAGVAKQGAWSRGKYIHQFSTWNDPSLQGNNPQSRYSPDSKSWKAAEAALDKVLGGSYDFTEGADHYHTHVVNPKWNRKMRVTAEIGNHKFFRSTKNKVDRSRIVGGYAQDELIKELEPKAPVRIPARPTSLLEEPVGPNRIPTRPQFIGGQVVETRKEIAPTAKRESRKVRDNLAAKYERIEKQFERDGDVTAYIEETKKLGVANKTTKEEIYRQKKEAEKAIPANAKSRRNERRAEVAFAEEQIGAKPVKLPGQAAMSVDDALVKMGAPTNPITGEVIKTPPLSEGAKLTYPEVAPVPPTRVEVQQNTVKGGYDPDPRPVGRPARVVPQHEQDFRNEFGSDAVIGKNGYAYKPYKDADGKTKYKSLGRVDNKTREGFGIAPDERGDKTHAGNKEKKKSGSFLERLFGKKEK